MKKTLIALALSSVVTSAIASPAIDSSEWPVDPNDFGMTAEQYIQTESHAFMSNFINRAGLNNFFHFPSLSTADDTWVVSPNQDSLYSIATVDATNGFSIEIPDVGDRYLSIHVLNTDHYSPYYVYGGGVHHFDREVLGSDIVAVGIRTSTTATPEDIKFVAQQIQPNIKIITDSNSVQVPELDLETMAKIRAELMPHYSAQENIFGIMDYGYVEGQDDWKRILVAAGAWGLSPDDTAMYIGGAPEDSEGNTCYMATFDHVDVEDFLSITAYNSDKFLMTNERNLISTNRGMEINEDGSFTAYFGGLDCENADKTNFIHTPDDGWNILLRAYTPNVDAFNSYQMPEFVKLDK